MRENMDLAKKARLGVASGRGDCMHVKRVGKDGAALAACGGVGSATSGSKNGTALLEGRNTRMVREDQKSSCIACARSILRSQ